MIMWLFLFFKKKLSLSHYLNVTPEMLKLSHHPIFTTSKRQGSWKRQEPKGLTCLVVYDFCQGWLLAAVLEVAEK